MLFHVPDAYHYPQPKTILSVPNFTRHNHASYLIRIYALDLKRKKEERGLVAWDKLDRILEHPILQREYIPGF